MSVSRGASIAALVLGVSLLVSGCSDEQSKADASPSASAVPLPENLCTDVLEVMSAEWQLSEDSHDTEAPTASCVLVGAGDTTLRVTMTDLASSGSVAAALDLVCRTAVGTPLEEGERRCQLASERVPGQPFTSAYASSFAATSSVLVVQFETADDTLALTAPGELATIEGALLSR